MNETMSSPSAEKLHILQEYRKERDREREKKKTTIFDQFPTNPVVRSLLTELSLP